MKVSQPRLGIMPYVRSAPVLSWMFGVILGVSVAWSGSAPAGAAEGSPHAGFGLTAALSGSAGATLAGTPAPTDTGTFLPSDAERAASTAYPIGPTPQKGFVRLPGHVLSALAKATPIAPDVVSPWSSAASAKSHELTLTLLLTRDDQAGFDRYMSAVYDPHSKRYRHFLTQAQLTQRFGPSRKAYESVLSYLSKNGFKRVSGSKNRMTLVVRGTRAQAERSLATRIEDFQLKGRGFYANVSDPALPARLASRVTAISGLNNLLVPEAVTVNQALNYCGAVTSVAGAIIIFPLLALIANITGALCTGIQIGLNPNDPLNYCSVIGSFSSIYASIINAICNGVQIGQDPGFGAGQGAGSAGGANPPPKSGSAGPRSTGSGYGGSTRAAVMKQAQPNRLADGTGQTIGLLEFDTYSASDLKDYLALIAAPPGTINQVSSVPVNGGVSAAGPGQSEVLLDIAVVLGVAPGAKIAVYDAPFDGTAGSYVAGFNAMIAAGVDIISNSWASCEDQISRADAQAIDQVLQNAAASGISVFNGAGDSGSTCLDGAAATVSVPADSPSATAVGGTSLTLGTGYIYGTETWWNGSAGLPPSGQGGYGVSRYFSQPSFQNGLTAATGRSVPDVAVDADPSSGYILCLASDGGCPDGKLYAGTSAAAPTWAGFAALLNEATGKRIGAFNQAIYPLARSAAFHNATSMGSDFAHVGLGSPNLDAIYLALTGKTAGQPDASASQLTYAATIRAGAQAPPLFTVPADGATAAVFVVTLRDANGNTVSGKSVSLATNSGTARIASISGTTNVANGAAVFEVTDPQPEKVSITATDNTDGLTLSQAGLVVFGVPPATAASLNVVPTNVAADGASTTTITITLKDSRGRPTSGKQINVSQSDGHSVITGPSPRVTDNNGQIQFTATDDVNETVTYTAVDASDGNLPIPETGTVTFNGAVASDCSNNPAVGANGYAVTIFASGFPAGDFFFSNINLGGCAGAGSPYFLSSGSVWIPDFRSGDLYQLGSSGGAVTSGSVLKNLGPTVETPIYGKDGKLYAPRFATGGGFTTGDVIQIDPTTGAIVGELATGLTCPNSLVTDPLSGDLFFNDECFGGGSDNQSVWRISNPGTKPTVSVYATLPGVGGQQQMVFAPDGTLYAVSGGGNNPEFVVKVAGTNTSAPAVVTTLTGITPDNGTIAVGQTTATGSAKTLLIHVAGAKGGSLETVDITGSTPSVDTVLATGDIGAGVVGPDGCYYVGSHHVVYKLAPSSGGCTLTPTNPAPSLTLSPASVPTNPAQGSAQTFTATLKNAAALSGVPVLFQVDGANPQFKLARTDTTGQAALTYTALNSGTDTVIATASIAAATQPSQPATTARTEAASLSQTMSAGAGVSGSPAYGGPGGGLAAGVRFPAIVASPALSSAPTLAREQAEAVSTTSSTTAPATVSLVSNSVRLSWNAGSHVTLLTLNASPTTGTVNKAVTVVASLTDISANPAAVVAGQTLSFTLGGSTCSAMTAANGTASCQITPSQLGTQTLTATFAGTSQLIGAHATTGFHTLAVPAPPPPVTISVSPTSIAAGSSATLTWSSTGATSCAASGAWSGTQPGSGTQSVTSAAVGTYTYTLTCTGAGGTGSGSAVLSATLTTVHVTAKSGGGALDWRVILLLGLLVLLRARPSLRAGSFVVCLVLAAAGMGSARAEDSAPVDPNAPLIDHLYVGVRAGSMPLQLDSGKVDQRLAADGYAGVHASRNASAAGGTVYVGYELNPWADVELGYSYRNAGAATLNGTVPSTSNIPSLLQDTSRSLNGYGNIYSVSFRTRFEPLRRVSIDPRLGVYAWNTKVTAQAAGVSESTTRGGGGITAGIGAAYRLWGGLEIGIGVDYFRGTQDNIATLYGGSVEWRFGHR